ncbi:MAG TPA: shikimate kinase [Chthoniobacterales bacterium]|jgi:shikimate kinase
MRIVPRAIVLIGFMGSGKTTVGRALARALSWQFRDTDEMVETKAQMTIAEVFERCGEESFRNLESEVLQSIVPASDTVTVTGGGVVLRRANLEKLYSLGKIVWLKADRQTLQERLETNDDRPLLRPRDRAAAIDGLLERRRKFYEEAADLTIDTSKLGPDAAARKIIDALQLRR